MEQRNLLLNVSIRKELINFGNRRRCELCWVEVEIIEHGVFEEEGNTKWARGTLLDEERKSEYYLFMYVLLLNFIV